MERFPRILAEVPESFEPKRLFLDDADPDPYVAGNVHKMGPTHSRRPGNFSAQNSANASGTGDDVVVLEVFTCFPYPIFFLCAASSGRPEPPGVGAGDSSRCGGGRSPVLSSPEGFGPRGWFQRRAGFQAAEDYKQRTSAEEETERNSDLLRVNIFPI